MAVDTEGKRMNMNIYKIYATAFIANPNHCKNIQFKTEGSTTFDNIEWTDNSGKKKNPKVRREIAEEFRGYEQLNLPEQTVQLIEERISGLTYSKIAEKHGCSKQAVHQKLQAIKTKLSQLPTTHCYGGYA